ncbi:hypothetical protein MMC18_002704 [Xylographa bjoerkii]|nr:hypothetical protein [Xylographa bjoerkii]
MSTRDESEQEEQTGVDMLRDPSQSDSKQDKFCFDDNETYFPVFCLTEVPDKYFDEFNKYITDATPWINISSDHPNRALEEIRADVTSEESSPIPFLGSTIEQVYDFFKNHLRPAGESTAVEHFTYFTFIVIDADCIRSKPLECIVCCDAPDYREADEEISLKQRRMPINVAVDCLCALEHLNLSVSELDNLDGWSASMIPPPTLVPLQNEWNRYRVATPAESRIAKRRMIKMMDGSYREGCYSYDRDREETTIARVPAAECIFVGKFSREYELLTKKSGGTLSLHANLSKESKDTELDMIRAPIGT